MDCGLPPQGLRVRGTVATKTRACRSQQLDLRSIEVSGLILRLTELAQDWIGLEFPRHLSPRLLPATDSIGESRPRQVPTGRRQLDES